jgi:chemotaxis protein methyltransferase CheR
MSVLDSLSPALTARQFADFSGYIARNLGIKMPPSKRVMLQSRIHRRTRELEFASLESYHERFFQDAGFRQSEHEQLLNLATTNKTDFFREAGHFAELAGKVLPAWLASPTGPVFRVWCAGCSTGEEAYTLAMTLLECRERTPFEFSILATDVSTRVLRRAREAVYTEEQVEAVPPELRRKYLLRSRDPALRQVRVAPEVRALVRFGHLNFMSGDYGLGTTMDLVFFRNVLIYFDRPTQCAVVRRICRHMHPGAHLFIAHSESLQGQPLPLSTLGASIYRVESEARP